jgi:RNA methyltransferase, TrmH family
MCWKKSHMLEITSVTSRDNPLVKELRKLAQDGAAYRKTGRFWIEGEHLCEAYLATPRKPVCAIVCESKRLLAQQIWAQEAIKLIVLPDALMAELSGLESVAGMGFVCDVPPDTGIQSAARTVIVDRLQDPGNVGSILRSAAAFGYQQVVALKGSVALYAPKVLRAGMGAHFGLHLVEAASVDDLSALQGPLAVTSSHQGAYLHELATRDPLSKSELLTPDLYGLNWVFGHEGQGASDALIACAAVHVRIAQPGGQESLNVAAAAAICLHASATASSALVSEG